MVDSDISNVANISPKLVKTIIDQEIDKLKITSSIASCVEDFADQAGLFGKGIAKLSTQNSLTLLRNEWLPNLSRTVDDFLKLTILTTSKQYTSLSLNLVNNVSKSFPEFVKNARKTIQTHFAKVISLQDDLRKCKANFSKLLEKYSRLVRETEMLLNLRSTSAMLENKVVDTDAQNLKEEGFSNLSFSRMLSKITPSEKKPQEKSREMIRELEQLELQLQNDVRRINVTRSEMLLEISKLYKTVEAVELERLTAMNEGASRFLLALDVVIDKHLDSFRSLLGAAELFDGQVELSLMFQKLAPIENVNQPTFLSNLDIEQERVIKISFIYGLNLQVDSLVDLIDHFHGLTHKLSCTMTEMLDVEQIFLKGTKRLFEKQGFYAIPNMDTIYDLANSSQSAAWLLKNYESENTRKSWELIFCLVGLIEELKIKDYDIYSEEISHQLDLIEKRLSFDRKELISVQSTNMRKIEQASIQSSKCRIKLSKVRQSLKERRNILRTTKGSTTIDQDKSFDEISADQDTPANIEEEVEVSTMMRRSSVKQTLEKANSTLKQVVGFESAADRLSRITSQIASLEDEEIQLMEVETQTNSNLITALETAESELKVCMKSIQDYLMVDIESIKGVLVTYFRSQAEKYDSLKSGSANSKLNEESDVLIKHDLSKFCKMLCSISELDFESSIFDTLSSESFESIKSDTITEEKKMLGIISNINRNVSDGCSVENDIVENRNNFQDNNSLAENNVTEPIFINHEESVEDVVPSQVAFGDSQEDKSSGKPNDENYLGSDELRQIASQTPKIDSPSKLSADFELKKFGLSNQDKVLESYSCALYPRKGLLTQGRLFITQHYLAFSGWPETRVLLCMIDIVSIEKTNTLGYIPNAITIKVEDKSEYFFGSLMDRDQCHSLIKNLIEVEKRITELHGSEGVKINRQLEYGYQTKSFFNKTKISELGEKNENQKAVDENSIDTAIVEAGDSDDLITEAVEFSFTPFLSNNTVVFLGEHQFSCSSSELWSKCWLQSSDYSGLLFNSGDLDIKGNDWQAFGQSAHEDVMKLNFTFKREFSFSHPRTTMLMFGPKNAPTKQCHYAYLPSKIARTSTSMEELKNCKPKKFIVLFITQFDGIPMADVFKVLQYWSFEDTDKGCYAKAVLAIHYVKSSMFKGQILSGSKEEIVTQVASWFNYAEAAVKSSAKNSEQIADSNRVPVADVPKVSNVEVKAASLNSEQNSKIIEYVLVIVAAISLAANIFFWVEITLLWKEVNSLKKSYSA